MKNLNSKSGIPAWAESLARKLAPHVRGGVAPERQARVLKQGIRALAAVKSKPHSQALPEQPFDQQLLALSPLYRRSRELYLKGGGKYRAALVSSPRTLSSPILLEQLIEYSPIERELVWAATDPVQSRDAQQLQHLMTLRTYASSLFHEQSHRILWRMLPPPPPLTGTGKGSKAAAGLRRYLNFVESLVIILDMALGDELGPALASVFYLSGVTYDPGTDAGRGLSRREYRNYLQAALHATYLNLEMYDPEQISRGIAPMFPQAGELAERAARRSGNLDRGFVTRTNPHWQRKHRVAVSNALSRLPGEPLELPEDPMDNRLAYLFAERWFDAFGL
jgi:hypothetical protein